MTECCSHPPTPRKVSLDARRPQNAGAGRPWPGEPPRAGSGEHPRTGRSDGRRGARSRRRARAGGDRLDPGGQPVVGVLPRPGAAARATHRRRPIHHPIQRYRRQCPTDTGQPGLRGHPTGSRRRGAGGRRGDVANPNATARRRAAADLHRAGRLDSAARRQRRERADGRGCRDPHQTGPPGVHLPDVRAGAAGQHGGVGRRPSPPHRANCGRGSTRSRCRIRTLGFANPLPRKRFHSRARRTG